MWILQYVSRDGKHILAAPRHVIEEALLPEPLALATEPEPCELLEALNKPQGIRFVLRSEREHMHVIRHDGVYEELKQGRFRGAVQIVDYVTRTVIDKNVSPSVCHGNDVVGVTADVVE